MRKGGSNVIQLIKKPSVLAEPVRFSRLKRMDDSPAHVIADFGDPSGEMEKGTALHAYMLGGESRVVIYRGGRRDDRIEAWRDFQAEHAGKHILIPSQIEAVEGMRRSLERNRAAMDLLDGVQEQRIEWTDLGRRCGGTPDVVHPRPGRAIGVELKTTRSAKPRRFRYQGRNMHYPEQCAWYKGGIEKTPSYKLSGPLNAFYIVAVESREPYPVTIFEMDEPALARAAEQNREWLERLIECERENHFPGYSEGILPWTAPDEDGGLDWEGVGDAAE